jgi:hypothetical protein
MAISCKKSVEDVPLKFHFFQVEEQPPYPMFTFDTVFTSIGSITRKFTVHNTSNNEITTTIFLAGGKNSNYSINVNGMPGDKDNNPYFKDVTIPKKDSIFIFVKVNIDPGNVNEPFLVKDSIVFLTDSYRQDVKLMACGQDAKYIISDPKTGFKAVAGETWTKEKPYVVYGWARIDSLGELIIEPGTKIYFHKNSGLWAFRSSKLNVNGTLEEPVIFRGDRLEKWFETDYAQWSGIWINEGTEVNIYNAIITNANTGIQVNPFISNGPIIVTTDSYTKIENTIIQNTQQRGVWSMFLNLEMTNCVIANNGASSLCLEGGNYTMKHVTVGNYSSITLTDRKEPACYVSNKISAFQEEVLWETKAEFINCILTGKLETEVFNYKIKGEDSDVQFENCLIKSKENTEYFKECLLNKDPLFTDIEKLDFKILQGSPAIGKGKQNIGVFFDILGNPRDDKPDIGAYQSN